MDQWTMDHENCEHTQHTTHSERNFETPHSKLSFSPSTPTKNKMLRPRGILCAITLALSVCLFLIMAFDCENADSGVHRQIKIMLDPRSIQQKSQTYIGNLADTSHGFKAMQATSNNIDPLQCKVSALPLTNLDDFKGHTIYMMGDSTMRHQFIAMCLMLMESGNSDRRPKIPTGTDWENLKIINPNEKHLDRTVRMCQDEHTRVLFSGTNGHGINNPAGLEFVRDALYAHDEGENQQNRRKNPSIIYFNGGLHFLQHHGLTFATIEEWTNAENLVVRFMQHARNLFGEQVRMVYMNSHALCEAKLNKSLIEAQKEQIRNPLPCVKYVEKSMQKSKSHFPLDPMTICIQSMFTTQSVAYLNQRIEGAIFDYMQQVPPPFVETVGCVDGFKHTYAQCEATSDGKHFQQKAQHELASFAQTVRDRQY